MKRKLLLTLAVAVMLVCMLVISVNADGIKKFQTDEFQSGDNITYIEGIDLGAYYNSTNKGANIDTLYDNSTLARIVLRNSDGTYTTYPTYYFIRTQDDWQGDYQFIFCDRVNAMSSVTGETYDKNSIIRIEYPELNPDHKFGKMSTNVESISNHKSLLYVYISSQFKVLNRSFDGCSALREVEFAPNIQLTKVVQFSFRNCDSIEKIILPNTVVQLEKEAIQSCDSLTEVRVGASLTTLNEKNSLNGVCSNDVKIYIPSTLDGTKYNHEWFTSKSTVFFTGTKSQAEAFGFETMYSYDEYISAGSPSGKMIVYGYSECDAFYNGNHQVETVNDCVAKCSICDAITPSENPVHKLAYECTYADGFNANGNLHEYCSNEYCEYTNDTTVAKIFDFAGYSVKESDPTAICAGFTVNHKSLSLYKKHNINATLEYGIVAFKSSDNNAVLEYKEGSVVSNKQNTVLVSIDDEYAGFDFILRGFNPDGSQDNIELVISAYIGNGTEIFYMSNTYGTAPETITLAQAKNN